jgi:hypothetical protein
MKMDPKLNMFWYDEAKKKYYAIVELENGVFVALREHSRGISQNGFKTPKTKTEYRPAGWISKTWGLAKDFFNYARDEPRNAFLLVIAGIMALALVWKWIF